MISAVIPAKNEEASISRVIKKISWLVDLVIIIVNGCQDQTINKALKISFLPTIIVFSKKPLGPDVPRSIGAKIAFEHGSDYVLFIDGDMDGDFLPELRQLIDSAKFYRYDMALTDCYPNKTAENSLAELVMYFRWKLNEKINMTDKIGYATPSHGPHVVSRKLLLNIPFKELAVPPVSLSLAAKYNLKIGIGTAIPHSKLQSSDRDINHAEMMSKTIIGDCIEAINIYEGKKRNRFMMGKDFIGYDSKRDWQTLNLLLGSTMFCKNNI